MRKNTVLNTAVRNRPVARGATEPSQIIGKPRLAIVQPDMRVGRDRQLHGPCDGHRHEDMVQVAVAMRTVRPNVARSQRLAQVKHHRDLAQAGILRKHGESLIGD